MTTTRSGDILILLGAALVAYSFLGPGFPLLVAGAIVMTYGGILRPRR